MFSYHYVDLCPIKTCIITLSFQFQLLLSYQNKQSSVLAFKNLQYGDGVYVGQWHEIHSQQARLVVNLIVPGMA